MRRHDLAWVRPAAPLRFLCGTPDGALAARVRDWLEEGRPLVVARQPADGGEFLLGLTLPASAGRRRLGCLVRREDVLESRPPLRIAACLDRLADQLAAPLAGLEERLAEHGIVAGVYGSLAWEALSGEAYRHPDSDVDLICDIAAHFQVAACLAALGEAAGHLRCSLDGEIRFPDGAAVAWRELAAALGEPGRQVLVKGPVEVGLRPVAALLAQFDEENRHV